MSVDHGDPATAQPHGVAPSVHVMLARDEDPPSLVWWGVMVLCLSTFAFGVLVGYLLGAT